MPPPTTVLIVDDTPDLRDLLRMALERTGEFQVIAEATNGREAIDAAQMHEPDLVLLDIAMPVMDGLEALPQVREISPGSIVVMLSGFGASTMTAKALAGGAHGYIQKGQPLSALIRQLRTLVDRDPRDVPVLTQPTAALHPGEAGATPDALDLAPIGFLQIRDGRILRANREATRLLGDLVGPQLPLAPAVPALEGHLARLNGEEGTVVLELGEPPRRLVATIRHQQPDALVYLHTQEGDEVELLRRAIGTAAHEIRTPVSVLMGVAETLVTHQADLTPDEQHRMLEAISRQTKLLDNITADLLAAGQAKHGSLTMQPEALDPAALVKDLIGGAEDVFVTCEDELLVLADPTRLQQMVSNLISNARKYGESPIVVRVRRDGDDALISVEDQGEGVPEAFRPRLFQEYARASGTRARGTGLGLFVVRALAEAQGGRVAYAPGTPRGAVFTITLPAVP